MNSDIQFDNVYKDLFAYGLLVITSLHESMHALGKFSVPPLTYYKAGIFRGYNFRGIAAFLHAILNLYSQYMLDQRKP